MKKWLIVLIQNYKKILTNYLCAFMCSLRPSSRLNILLHLSHGKPSSVWTALCRLRWYFLPNRCPQKSHANLGESVWFLSWCCFNSSRVLREGGNKKNMKKMWKRVGGGGNPCPQQNMWFFRSKKEAQGSESKNIFGRILFYSGFFLFQNLLIGISKNTFFLNDFFLCPLKCVFYFMPSLKARPHTSQGTFSENFSCTWRLWILSPEELTYVFPQMSQSW